MPRFPVPPFDAHSAAAKVQAAEDAWNTRDPHVVSQAYTVDSVWRNRSEFVTGRDQIEEFLSHKWERELDYALRKDLWAYGDNQIGSRVAADRSPVSETSGPGPGTPQPVR